MTASPREPPSGGCVHGAQLQTPDHLRTAAPTQGVGDPCRAAPSRDAATQPWLWVCVPCYVSCHPPAPRPPSQPMTGVSWASGHSCKPPGCPGFKLRPAEITARPTLARPVFHLYPQDPSWLRPLATPSGPPMLVAPCSHMVGTSCVGVSALNRGLCDSRGIALSFLCPSSRPAEDALKTSVGPKGPPATG